MKQSNYKKTTATNTRGALFKYYKVDNNKSLAVPAGRCKCGKITDLYCTGCFSHICEKHIFTNNENYFCGNCKPDDTRELTKKEIRNIRKAEL